MAKKATETEDGTVYGAVSNGAQNLIRLSEPYKAIVKIQGTEKLLLHSWNNEAIKAKSEAKRGSAQKKTDDVENYVQRDEDGHIAIPTLNFCASIREAGRDYQDPSNPRKMFRDRLKAIVVPFKEWGKINGGVKKWEEEDSRRVVIQKAGITRTRPAFQKGWTIEFEIMVMAPEYLSPELLRNIIDVAGLFQAIGDFRPTYGRYRVESFRTEKVLPGSNGL